MQTKMWNEQKKEPRSSRSAWLFFLFCVCSYYVHTLYRKSDVSCLEGVFYAHEDVSAGGCVPLSRSAVAEEGV